jgi:hypothetical protein
MDLFPSHYDFGPPIDPMSVSRAPTMTSRQMLMMRTLLITCLDPILQMSLLPLAEVTFTSLWNHIGVGDFPLRGHAMQYLLSMALAKH